MAFLASIGEGQGEVEALPALLYRLARLLELPALSVTPPIRVKSGSFLNHESYFRRHIELAASKAIAYGGAVSILLDCDDDCPAKLGPRLLAQARAVRSDAKFFVSLAYRELETWFIAAAESLRGQFGLPADLTRPANFESIRNAKGWLGERMPDGYDPVRHQHLMAKEMDIGQALTARSFHRLAQHLPLILQA